MQYSIVVGCIGGYVDANITPWMDGWMDALIDGFVHSFIDAPPHGGGLSMRSMPRNRSRPPPQRKAKGGVHMRHGLEHATDCRRREREAGGRNQAPHWSASTNSSSRWMDGWMRC